MKIMFLLAKIGVGSEPQNELSSQLFLSSRTEPSTRSTKPVAGLRLGLAKMPAREGAALSRVCEGALACLHISPVARVEIRSWCVFW